MNQFLKYATTCLILGQSIALYSAAPAPQFGTQTPENFYRPSLQLHYYNGFEDPGQLIDTSDQLFEYTTDSATVIHGQRSVLLETPAKFVLEADDCAVEGGETYVVEFDYELADPSTSQIFVGFYWPGFETGAPSFTLPGISPAKSTFRHNMRLPEGQTDIRLEIGGIHEDSVIDNVRIYKLVPEVYPVEPNLLNAGFPRLSNYHVFSSYVGAITNDSQIETVQDHLSRYHLVTGTSIDFTHGTTNDYLNMKLRNPNQLLLPYHQTFVSVLATEDPPVAGSANLLNFFNQGLADEWFMKNPEGERLQELIYLDNYQMNLTEHCPVVDGKTFNDYTRQYLQETIYASGYWSGVHFDQSEWYTNPLLSITDPFNQEPAQDIDIDLDNDGVAETEEELMSAWYASYFDYFDSLEQTLGPSAMFFGNAGEIPRNEDVISRVNGLLFEHFSPYRRDENENYQTQDATFWYHYMDVHDLGRKYFRSPQIPSTQMTGEGLGVIDVDAPLSTNGLEQRVPEMVVGDYLRMRLGLTTSLMTDGFFGYDFVDNASLPVAWLDEYAVDLSTGEPSTLPKHTQYLGQPLGDRVELDYPQTILLDFDFEDGIPQYGKLEEGIFLNADNITVTQDSTEVIEGSASGKMAFTTDPTDPQFIVVSLLDSAEPDSPPGFTFEEGTTYQAFIDYRILDYNPVNYELLLMLAVTDFDPGIETTLYDFATVWQRDVNIGQQQTLRASVKVDTPNHQLIASMADNGEIVVDRIRLIEGTGGVMRRDFENGVVLVNPTPEPQTVPLAEIQGPLGRTGLKRISGTQMPLMNTGLAVTGPITIDSGDGIILLADHHPAPMPETPTNFTTSEENGKIRLNWTPATGTVSGYVFKYGLSGGDLTYIEQCGLPEDFLLDTNALEPGRSYDVAVAAYDYLGRMSVYSTAETCVLPGTPPTTIPAITSPPDLQLGATVTISGSELASSSGTFLPEAYPTEYEGTQIRLNGVPAQIVQISPAQVTIKVPENLGGNTAILRVSRNGISSLSQTVTVVRPTAEGSAFSLIDYNIDLQDDLVEFKWSAFPFKEYRLESSSDLSTWDAETTWLPALRGYNELALPLEASAGTRFYRLRERE